MESYEIIDVKTVRIIIHSSFKEQFESLNNKKGSYPLFGRIYDDFDVCHFSGLLTCPSNAKLIGRISFGTNQLESFEYPHEYPYLHVIFESETIEDLKVEINIDEVSKQSEDDFSVEFIDLDRLFIRIDENETPLKIVKDKKVAIIGMGSGGSLLALYLAKSGINNLVFIDDDRLEAHNIIRHICDLNHLGRFKTRAVKEYLKNRFPEIVIKSLERKFDIHTRTDAEFYLDLFADVHLIIAASGDHIVNFALNDFIHSNNLQIPIIFAGTFDRVKGGLMFKVDPRKDDYCYHCIYSDSSNDGNIQTGSVPSTSELEKKIVYDRSMQEQIAQPGLGLDIDNLTILLTKFCLDLLLTGNEHGLYHFSHNFYMWFNRTIMSRDESSVKFEGLELYFYEDLEKNEKCPFHGPQLLKNKVKED